MTSFAISPYTMAAALHAGGSALGIADWQAPYEFSGDPGRRRQDAQKWLAEFARREHELAKIPEIAAHGTTSIADHAEWLRERGWDTSIRGGGRGDIYLAAVLSVVASWERQGRKYTPVVRDQSGEERLGDTRAALDGCMIGNSVALIPTTVKSVSVLVAPVQLSTKVWPVETAEDLRSVVSAAIERSTCARRLGQLDFPQVHLRCSSQARHMIGIWENASGGIVNQAAEAFDLQLSHRGVVARAKAELGLTRGLDDKPRLYIDRPFVVAVLKGDLREPLFSAYCDRDCWTAPPEVPQ